MKKPFIEEKKLNMDQYPDYVRLELTKRLILTYVLLACAIAALITTRNMMIFLGVLALTILQAIYAFTFWYLFTRDKVYIIEGICDSMENSVTFRGILGNVKRARIVVPGSSNKYYITMQKPIIFSRKELETGQEITIYFAEGGAYRDVSENIIINSPLIIKT